jgi:ligand-binding sensor domain-containing protein
MVRAEETFAISRISHPSIAGREIKAVAARDGLRVWATINNLFVETSDGSVQIFTPENSPLSAAGNITSVAVLNNEIWVAQNSTFGGFGVCRYNFEKWETMRFPDAPGLLNNRVVCMHVDADDYLWLGHREHGASRFIETVNASFGSYKIMHFYDNSLLTIFMQLTHLWLGSSNGIVRLRTEIKSNVELNVDTWLFPEFPAREVFSICDYTDDRIIAGTSRGIAIFDGKKWAILRKTDGIKALPVTHLQRTGNRIWLGSPVGIQTWQDNLPGRLLTEADGLPSSHIKTMCVDENGNILIGTARGAAIIIKP